MVIFAAVLLFSILILVHEAGHFFSAKKAGIRVDEFGMGYPPRLIGVQWQKKERRLKVIFGLKRLFKSLKHTELDADERQKISINQRQSTFLLGRKSATPTIYSINLIPFGGFVKIFGEDKEDQSLKSKDSFNSKSALKRSIVILSGVSANILLAIVFLSIMFALGAPVIVDESKNVSLRDEKIVIAGIAEGSPAEKIGLQAGDGIEKLEFRIKNQESEDVNREEIVITEIKQVQDFINAHKGEEITIVIKRGKEVTEKIGIPRIDFPKNEGPLGISLAKTGIKTYPWYSAIGKGISYAFQMIGMIFSGLFMIIQNLIVNGKMIGGVAGPIGIFKLTSQAAALGINYFLHFGALISLNLAVLNVLPFPALDGGRFLFILIEKIKGSPVNVKVEQSLNRIGFALLMLLMLFITIKDIMKLF